ncbi:hypothetical protein [Vibrio anguillarum]|uniref:hypothetical protein n=1 Tax=Vibrio anguillarum TaxID=55601 RepID=UPI000842241B|nr:hypothetical protein [Vibrio anguillarum]
MRLKLIKNHHEINADEVLAQSEVKYEQLLSSAIVNGDFSVFQTVINKYTNVFDYDMEQPYWLQSKFSDEIWEIELENPKWKKVIRFSDVILDDGEPLTSSKHSPLLLAFKYWLVSLGNPRFNGGKLIKPPTLRAKIQHVIAYINTMLVFSPELKLSNKHLEALDRDSIMDILVRLSKYGITIGCYDFYDKLTQFLLNKTKEISDGDAEAFGLEYPHVLRNLMDGEVTLKLTSRERLKACCWLARNRFYAHPKGSKIFYPTPNSQLIAKELFDGVILGLDDFRTNKLTELALFEPNRDTEYPALPNNDKGDKDGRSERVLERHLPMFKSIMAIADLPGVSNFDPEPFFEIGTKDLRAHLKLTKEGRTRTIPSHIIFKAVRNAFEFSFEFADDIFDSMANVLINAPKNKYIPNGDSKTTTLKVYKDEGYKRFLPKSLSDRGVLRLCVDPETCRFEQLRGNEVLLDLYHLLIGSIQILVGALMARRNAELLELPAISNIITIEKTVSSKDGEEVRVVQEHFLKFKNRKSGSGGKHAEREVLERAIPESIAELVLKLEAFNTKLVDAGFTSKDKIKLFNSISQKGLRFIDDPAVTYNQRLDLFCDYFETLIVEVDGRGSRRVYFRQHQFRRFFAMLFFWSKVDSQLDALRHFLGHTDMQHLYNYISESDSGEVLNGVKASALVDKVIQSQLDNLEDLNRALADRFGVSAEQVELTTLSQAAEDYEDEEDYSVTPNINEINDMSALEEQVLDLLNDEVISFEPEFFTVKAKGDSREQDYKFILRVNDLEEEQ